MELKKLDRELYLISRAIFYPSLHPINLNEEQQKIFRDKTYNPQFRYERQYIPESLKLKLKKLKFPINSFGALYQKKKDIYLKQIDYANTIGTKKFSKVSVEKYGVPSREIVQKAYKFVKLPNLKSTAHKLSLFSSTKKFLDALLKQGYNWKVKGKDMVVSASINNQEKTLYLNKQNFSEMNIHRLIVHEIGTHITRTENALKQKYKLFFMGFPNYISTEEGLAVYNEEQAGIIEDNFKKYAGRVIAVHISLKNSFSTVYNELLEFFPKEIAWNLTVRAKRGISDTSKPGANTKDHIYLTGYYKVKNFINKGGNLKDLYIGKIGVEHVDIAKKLAKLNRY